MGKVQRGCCSPIGTSCIGYLGHPFKNKPFETEKDQHSLLANTAG
jgi:hypothetical protein